MSNLEPEAFVKAAITADARWSALVRLDTSIEAIGGLRAPIVRHPRLLVPIDVQALYVPPPGGGGGDPEAMARVPLALRTDAEPATDPFDPGTARAPGVHLHWAMPDALARGASSSGGASFPALADRWVVLRLLARRDATRVEIAGWIVEADTARVVPLADWPAGAAGAAGHGPALPPGGLTAGAGGSPLWTGFYDASFGRFGLHDPLAGIEDGGEIADGSATYLVAGWWSDPRLDPLDAAHTEAALHARLEQLRWTAPPGDPDDAGDRADRGRFEEAATSLGVELVNRYSVVEQVEQVDGARTVTRSSAGTKAASEFRQVHPLNTRLAEAFTGVYQGEPTWPRAALLHGMVLGVPVAGAVDADRRPATDRLGVALGLHLDDVATAFAADGLGTTDPKERRILERTLAAFAGGLLSRIGAPDGVADLDQYEHGAGFAARPMGNDGVDHLRQGAGGAGVTAGRRARSVAGGSPSVGPAGTAPRSGAGTVAGASGPMGRQLSTELVFARSKPQLLEAKVAFIADQLRAPSAVDGGTSDGVQAVARPAPRTHRALDPQVAIRGAAPSRRHGGDGTSSPDGRLRCRWPRQVITGIEHLLNGDQVLRVLPTSAVPAEVLALAREAVLLNPYLVPWLADVAAGHRVATHDAAFTRLKGEAVLHFGAGATYGAGVASALADSAAARTGGPGEGARSTPVDGTFSPLASSVIATVIEEQLYRRSLYIGVAPDPVAVTAWSQPWVPLVLDWEVVVDTGDRLDGWQLGDVDLEPDDDATRPTVRRTVRGRSVVTTGAAGRLGLAIADFLRAEDALEKATSGPGQAAEADEGRLAALAASVGHLDLLSVTLQGLRGQLLGLGDVPGAEVVETDGPVGPAVLTGGSMTLTRLCLVDAFGRRLDVPVDPVARVAVPEREKVAPGTLRLRPRLNVDARWMFRLVGAGDAAVPPAEATVDQRPDGAPVNPVAGFVLPDHIDEALEVFDAAGTPLGQLFHEAVGGGVAWDIAPGRPGPPDAGPLFDLTPAQAPVGRLAAGLIAADATARDGQALAPGSESALSALLRAIDTTLWTVDPLASMGTEHIAGLVGRPIAVVTATLRLDLRPDATQVDRADPVAVAAWEELVRQSADRPFPVQLGTLTRADDSLLGFFVDGDFSRVHVVDKAVLGAAVQGGRSRGFQAAYGETPAFPAGDALAHPYVLADDRLLVRPGQTVGLHLLMHPGGSVHLSSGVLPRKAIALARDWVGPGLAVMSPSVRVGPVLVDPSKIRLPLVASLGEKQAWTRRDTPASWKDDPILSATQSALLPELPHEVQEGYIRVLPVSEPGGAGGGAGGSGGGTP